MSRQKIEDIDDIVKSVNGELAISKKGLITIRGGNYTTSGGFDDRVDRDQATGTYYDVFATVFSRDATPL